MVLWVSNAGQMGLLCPCCLLPCPFNQFEHAIILDLPMLKNSCTHAIWQDVVEEGLHLWFGHAIAKFLKHKEPIVQVCVELAIVIALRERKEFRLAMEVHEFGGAFVFAIQFLPKLKPISHNIYAKGASAIIDMSSDVAACKRPTFLRKVNDGVAIDRVASQDVVPCYGSIKFLQVRDDLAPSGPGFRHVLDHAVVPCPVGSDVASEIDDALRVFPGDSIRFVVVCLLWLCLL